MLGSRPHRQVSPGRFPTAQRRREASAILEAGVQDTKAEVCYEIYRDVTQEASEKPGDVVGDFSQLGRETAGKKVNV